MNTKVVNDAYRLVRALYLNHLALPAAEEQVDRFMRLKNLSVRLGLRARLADEQLEELALAAVFHNLDLLDAKGGSCGLGSIVAERFLCEQGFNADRVMGVLRCLEVLSADFQPGSPAEDIFCRAYLFLGYQRNLSCPSRDNLVA